MTKEQNMTGHNSGDMTENERKALTFHHLRKRMAHNAKLDEIKTAKKSDGKTAQHDGIVLGDLDYAIKVLDADDKATVTDRFLAQGEMLTWLNVIPGFQADLLRDRAPAMERIEGEGQIAGLAGKDATSPYDKGSDEDSAWLRGWESGQKIMRDNLESAMTKKNAERTNEAPEADGDDPFADAAE